MKRIRFNFIMFCFTLFCLTWGLAPLALARQSITIDSDVIHNVHGNGDLANGGVSDPPASLRDPNNNEVIINAEVDGDVFGGASDTSATGNTVTVNSGGKVTGDVQGGSVINPATASTAATGNSVSINGGTVGGDVDGGYAESNSGSATATGNTVSMNGGTVEKVSGGKAHSISGSATTTGNSVSISGGTVIYNVFGGEAYSQTGSATATGNSVTISNSDVDGYVSGGEALSTGDSGSATATGNSVSISNSDVGDYVSDGYAKIDSGAATPATATATATGNSVTINDGTVNGTVSGGEAYIVDASATATAEANGNSVTINGGTMNGDVYGGYADIDSGSATATANGNSVTINGGTLNHNVYGGHADSNGSATATGNTVTISGNTTFDPNNSSLYGGWKDIISGDVFSDNTLNLHSAITVYNLGNFEFLNFYLPANLGAGDAMLTVGNEADITNAKISVGFDGSSPALAVNDEITLIDGPITGTPDSLTAQGMRGVTVKYDFAISANLNDLIAKVSKAEVNERVKALSEGFLAGLALVNQGADLIAGAGLGQAVAAAEDGFGAFGAVAFGKSSYDSGSHVDMSSVALLTGFSRGLSITPGGRLTLGAFFEYGSGDYDTYNSFNAAADVRGDGETERFGGGILGRLDFNATDSGHAYVEASGRLGRAENDYSSTDLRDFAGRQAGFDSSSAYYGLHLGAGYLWDISDMATLDIYAKYFWSSLAGDTVTLSTGDRVAFEDADSQRLRLGGRFSFSQSAWLTPYVGLAWEHEFDGEARATTGGFSIDPPTLKGDTGIGEIGLNIKPSADRPLSFDLGLSGYAGQRQGVMGTLTIKYDF